MALASVERSRARVAWTGYPAWYWLTTAAGLAALPIATLLPDWLGLASVGVVAGLLTMLAVRASRGRGVCEYWTRCTMLGISKSALSKHISVLTDAGYVRHRRAVRDTRQRVWLGLTETGRSAYQGHVAALRRIVGDGQAQN